MFCHINYICYEYEINDCKMECDFKKENVNLRLYSQIERKLNKNVESERNDFVGWRRSNHFVVRNILYNLIPCLPSYTSIFFQPSFGVL